MMIRQFTSSLTLLTVILLAILGCQRSSPTASVNPAKAKIDSLENEMRLANEKNLAEPDLKLAMYLAQAYQEYEADYPSDSLSSYYLFKAGQVIENVFDDKRRAGELYFTVYKKYPKSEWAPYALFMTGNLYHTIGDTVHAVQMLDFFMAKYPDHKLKQDAAAMILNMGQVPDTSSRPVKNIEMSPL